MLLLFERSDNSQNTVHVLFYMWLLSLVYLAIILEYIAKRTWSLVYCVRIHSIKGKTVNQNNHRLCSSKLVWQGLIPVTMPTLLSFQNC